MIKRIKVKNFKALKMAELGFKNLNLFAGMDGMGGSSLLLEFPLSCRPAMGFCYGISF
jgi:AAA15 family ATPase/GTPase